MRGAFLAVLLLVGVANAQENLVAANAVPAATNATPIALTDLPDAPSTPKFWSMENKVNFSLFAAELTADAITTQRGLNHGMREANPLARPFVSRGAGGEAAASVLGLGLGVGTAYLLHRTHHHKAERIAVRVMLAAEGAAVAQNIAVLW